MVPHAKPVMPRKKTQIEELKPIYLRKSILISLAASIDKLLALAILPAPAWEVRFTHTSYQRQGAEFGFSWSRSRWSTTLLLASIFCSITEHTYLLNISVGDDV